MFDVEEILEEICATQRLGKEWFPYEAYSLTRKRRYKRGLPRMRRCVKCGALNIAGGWRLHHPELAKQRERERGRQRRASPVARRKHRACNLAYSRRPEVRARYAAAHRSWYQRLVSTPAGREQWREYLREWRRKHPKKAAGAVA